MTTNSARRSLREAIFFVQLGLIGTLMCLVLPIVFDSAAGHRPNIVMTYGIGFCECVVLIYGLGSAILAWIRIRQADDTLNE